ncbi:MAG: zinc ribbon domain-containing protein [Anaerolineales bacterium]|nr:zinc ribbon domain-containing protein [Anaerolineales bacterium]
MNASDPLPHAWQPPPDFVAVASALEGVTVFAPRPVETAAPAPRTYRCPQCGAATEFNVAAGGIACEHCGYRAQTEAGAPHAEHLEFTLEALAAGAQGWGVTRRQLHCEACGADLALAEGALTATCPFCASSQVNVRAAAGDSVRPGGVAPFSVVPEAVRAKAHTWLGSGWFHPAGLAASARLDSFVGVYLPFWLFGAHLTAGWKAEVGHEETESYLDTRDMKRKTRQVVRWRWESGQAGVDVINLPIAGSSRVNSSVLSDILPFDLGAIQAFSPDFLAGWQAQGYDVPLPKAWEEGKAHMREQAQGACRAQIRSGHVRNFHMTVDFGDETWRYVLLPVYVSAYRFDGKIFQVMVNGQTGAVAGQKPVAWAKVWAAIALMLAPGLLLSLIGLPLLLAAGLGLVPLGIGVVLFVAGLVGSFILYTRVAQNERGVARSE